MYHKKRLPLNYIVLYLLIFFNIFDSGGGFGLKYIVFFILGFALLIKLSVKDYIKLGRVEPLLFVILPLISLLYSVGFRGITLNIAVSALSYNISILVFWYLINYSIDIHKILKNYMVIMTLVSILIILISLYFEYLILSGNETNIWRFHTFATKYRLGLFGIGSFSGFKVPIVYPNISMFLIFALSLACYYKNKTCMFLILIGNLLTFATANIILAFAILFIWFLFGSYPKKYKVFIVAVVMGITILTIIAYSDKIIMLFSEVMEDITGTSSGSTVKIGHIKSALDNIFKNPINFLFGMGAGAEFYSIGINSLTRIIEVSPIDFWRQFGSLYTILFFAYIGHIIWQLIRKRKDNRIIGYGLLFLCCATATNPQLMNPTFLIILFMCRKLYDPKAIIMKNYSFQGKMKKIRQLVSN